MPSEIEQWIERKIERGESFTSAELREALDVSRQAANYHLRNFREAGRLRKMGTTRDACYEPSEQSMEGETVRRTYQPDGLEEHEVFEQLVVDAELRGKLNENGFSIVQYGFTEVMNNAIEHAEAETISVDVTVDDFDCAFRVHDDGIGIFQKIQRDLELENERRAVQELIKGKVTTDPEHHSGEGLFFTTRSGDEVSVESSNFRLTFDNEGDEVGLVEVPKERGTTVEFTISRQPRRSMRDVFNEYSGEDFDYQFGKTDVTIELFKGDEEEYVSRSRARRLLHGLDKFEVIELDFEGIDGIGQGFADEVFRVFADNHPDVEIEVTNANDAVKAMIEHVQTT